ncbi:F-box/LRR-repeat protein 7-like protein [Leptotrombidium deliense]|uniref:F-box/LRR-repeat protein 7-like protein n=1 Tax=Leptotrombidium deliense TaxID=299467 RepID=A0A443SU41_9ACAR|nr:F-box/LRR-repeat protein 7-like protein [Leptotrombidium deliense]
MFITSKHKLQKSLGDNLKSLTKSRTSDADLGYHTLVATQSQSGSSIHSYNMTASNSLCSTPTKVACNSNASTLTKHSCDTSINYFDKLTDEIILKIFGNLTANDLCFSCARVCRRWYYLTWTPSLWHSVVIKHTTRNVDFALRSLFRLISREIYCREMIPSIRDLSIKHGKKRETRRSSNSVPVESLDLSGCVNLTDKGLLLIARKCSELKSLYIRGCMNITDLGMNEVLTSCFMLEMLEATGCHNIKLNITRLPQIPSTLRHVNLSSCVYIDDYSLKIFVKLFGVQLTHLYLRRCPLISDHLVKCLTAYCPCLREVSFGECPQLTDFFCFELSLKLGSRLRYLSLSKCERITNAGIKQVGKFCNKLRYLNLRGCHLVSDEGLAAIARGSSTRLRAVDVGKCNIGDEGLKALSDNCPNLRKLSVRECSLVTDIGVSLIAYYCRSLVRINVSNCCNVSAEAHRYVKRFCKKCVIELNGSSNQ